MSLTCECGAYRSFEFREGVDICTYCGRTRAAARLPLMVVTGGAASGKSTICRDWETDPRVLALDLDIVGRDPVVRKPGDRDYVTLWGFQLRLALEVQLNGYAPMLCGFCLPEQVLANEEACRFAGVHVLALVCDEEELMQRIADRPGGHEATLRPEIHYDLNRRLREMELQPPNSLSILDTSGTTIKQTLASARHWVEGLLAAK